ncbi:MAG: DUF308 domain-containing protein [Bacteroidales bacterium]|nr:DUF308 domain-containing protein [Candidatus Cacconaster caballi]
MKNSIYRALGALVVGLVLLIWPGFVAGSFVRIIGAVIVLMGVPSIIRFFRDRNNAALISGIIEVLIGMFLLFWPEAVLRTVFIVLALVIIIFAVEHIVRIARSRGRWPLYILPACMTVIGIIILCQAEDAAKFVVILFGAALVAYSLSELFTAYFAGKITEGDETR